MLAIDIIHDLLSRGFTTSLTDTDGLSVAPAGQLTKDDRDRIKAYKNAAQSLAKFLGIDSQGDLQRARSAIRMYCELNQVTPDVAITVRAPHLPPVISVKDE